VGVNTTLESELMRDAEGDLEASGLDLDSDTIVAALDAARGSPTRAARSLGLRNRHVLYRLMKKHGIESRGA
jgi:two-component system nitrogen regulation response regulator GlnG/two-component system response regulator HydG